MSLPRLLSLLTLLLPAFFTAFSVAAGPFQSPETRSADVIIYGGTSAGVSAAVQTARMGHSVILIESSRHIGGLTSGGLGFTDSGDKRVIGGLSREFYQRVRRYYDDPAAWEQERAEDYARYRANDDAMWTFEPRVAERILRAMLDEAKVPVIEGQRLDRNPGGVRVESGRILEIRMESGLTFSGKQFLDATYEGDLMAVAAVSYTVGREANSVYGETLNGNQVLRKYAQSPFSEKGRSIPHSGGSFKWFAGRCRGCIGGGRWHWRPSCAGLLLPHVHVQQPQKSAHRFPNRTDIAKPTMNCFSATLRLVICGSR